ncbi:MAG: BREX system Lon protease-like protein BrxL [Minicystis sp.]
MQTSLREKIERIFEGLAVDKRQALSAGFESMPRFVTEFLLATARAQNSALGIEEVRERIRKFSVDADRKGEFISRLMREQSARLIALLEVEPRPERNAHVGRIAQIDGNDLAVPDAIVAEYPELLYGGLWGSAVLRYDTSTSRPRIHVDEFKPYQLTRPNMAAFRQARAEFTLEEWIDLLITSAGYRPEAFPTLRHRLLLLCRLVPLTQPNVNLVEMGPRGTGKSYLLRNLSSRVFLLAGARATPAALLYDLNRKQLGVIGRKKVVVFDEVGATVFPDKSLVASLKDYMESGNISRGGRSLMADCSFCFAGNLELAPDGRLPHRDYMHYFEVLPAELCDVAIADRIHGFIPGWEMPKISDSVLADGVGLVSDYFGEVLGELRRDITFHDYVRQQVTLENTTLRDRTAVERITSGLLKMLFPDGKIDPTGRDQALQVAVELRQRVHDQMVKMAPGEFRTKRITFPGMPSHEAPDILGKSALEEQDVEANQRELVGKITILLVSNRGGGDVGFVECAHVDGSGLSVTGLRGAVLEQSVKAAYDALLNLGVEFGLTPEVLRSRKMSVHLVNIAEPKDGPSAGVAFALAMLSAATQRPIRPALAVTGELSIHGNVNPVGGIAEKLSAALLHGRKTVIIPAANAVELARLTDLTARLDVRPVQALAEAVRIAFEE